MSTYNYAALRDTAASLIERFGREVTFRRLSRDPSDTAKPWRAGGDPEDVVVTAVIVGDVRDGDPRRPAADQVLVAAGGDALEGFDQMIDGGVSRRVESIEVLKPGDDVVLYIAKVLR